MFGAMLSTTLIQFSVDRWNCVPSLFDLRPMAEVVKLMATSFKRSCAHTATLSVPDPEAGHCLPMPLLETYVYIYTRVYVLRERDQL